MIPRHIPVMVREVVDRLAPPPGPSLIVDGTLGEGGHAAAFLESFSECRIVGIDADPVMRERAARRLTAWKSRVDIRPGWTDEVFSSWSGPAPNRILIDLGISVFHYDSSGRGFTFRGDEPLDMRLDVSEGSTAADLVNSLPEGELADLIFQFGEERYSRRIARSVVLSRRNEPIDTAEGLAEIVRRAVPPAARRGRSHPATRTFQALRIAVNRELTRLDALLDSAPDLLAPGGRLGIISFHSLEDRAVKRAFRSRAQREDPDFAVVTKKPLVPSEAEVRENPPSRSAKFRVIEKLEAAA